MLEWYSGGLAAVPAMFCVQQHKEWGMQSEQIANIEFL